MTSPLRTRGLNKIFSRRPALKDLTFELPPNRVAALLGRNGAGKSTFIHLACGLLLPSSGSCHTLGRAVGELDAPELDRLGVVFQEGRFLDWMRVQQQINFHASFYSRWDKAREARLLADLELDPTRKIGELSVGDRQKLGIVLGVCHRPSLLLLDEPVSSLDPIARARMLGFLVDLVREDESTIVISSHILSDVEKVVDWVICLDDGELATSAPLDELQESHAEWTVTSSEARLPAQFAEPWILGQQGNSRQARLLVRPPASAEEAAFTARHGAVIERRALNLDQIFPLLINQRRKAA